MSAPDWRAVGPVAAFDAAGDQRPLGARFDDLPEGPLRVAVVRREGDFHAFQDRCPHRGAAFSEVGFVDDEGHLVCGWHFWAFHVPSGIHTHLPTVCLRRFRTRVRDGIVEVDVSRNPAVDATGP